MPISEEDQGTFRMDDVHASCAKAQDIPPQGQALPIVSRKAHRKTNKRKMTDSNSLSCELSQEDQQERLFSVDRQSSSGCQEEEFKDLHLNIPIFTETVSNNRVCVLQLNIEQDF